MENDNKLRLLIAGGREACVHELREMMSDFGYEVFVAPMKSDITNILNKNNISAVLLFDIFVYGDAAAYCGYEAGETIEKYKIPVVMLRNSEIKNMLNPYIIDKRIDTSMKNKL